MASVAASSIKTSKPKYGPNGLITGYDRSYSLGQDYPVINAATGKLESVQTGKPWVGAVNTSAAAAPGATTTGGATLPQFGVTKTVKQPEIANAINTQLGQQAAVTTDLNKTFTDFLNEARAVNAQAKTQLATDQAAINPAPTAAALSGINRTYQQNQEGISSDIAQRNNDYAANTKATLERLSAENAAYETAAKNVANQAVAAAGKRNNLYQLTTGTPGSNSGALTNRAIRAYADVNTPLQRELSARRYSQIANIEQPLERELYGNDESLLSRRSALETDYAGRGTDTAKYLQDLALRTAGMSREMAQTYLRNLGLPFEIAQRVMAGDIANLGALQGLDERANFYTVNTPFDPSRIPVTQSYSPSYPQRSYVGGGDYNPTFTASPTGRSYTATGGVSNPGTILPDWVNAQRRAAGWQADGSGQYTINSPLPTRNDTGNWANE